MSAHSLHREKGADLLDEVVRVTALVRLAVNGHAVLVELEGELQRLRPDTAAVVAASAKLASKVVEYLEILHIVIEAVLRRVLERQRLPGEQRRSILVSEPRRRPVMAASAWVQNTRTRRLT